jgi:hypothetical protein
LGNNVYAEGIWSVNGYHLSNVNILHKMNTVNVSGRIQGGQAADYLKIRILISNDNGFRGWAETSVQHYVGKGELFESQFKYYSKARLWNIERIEVIGSTVSNQKQNEIQNTSCTVTSTQELMINLYDYGKSFKHTFTVGPSTPYQLNVRSGNYRAEIIQGNKSNTQSVSFPPNSCTWDFK